MALLRERASESSTPTFEMFSFVNSHQDSSFIKWIIREVSQTPLAPRLPHLHGLVSAVGG